jgi:hypothetical protein
VPTVSQRIIQQFPHCDSRILHAPFRRDKYVTTLWSINDTWTLSSHQIDRVPDLLAAACTSRGSHARRGTSPLVIPLTEAASAVLKSRLTSGSSGANVSESAAKTALSIALDVALPASRSGDSTIYQPLNDELNWPKPKGTELPLAEPTFARHALAHARIVMPVSLGGSWSLTIGTVAGWETQRLPDLSDKALSTVLSLKSLSVISSALTAIGPELTPERWQQEQRFRSGGECEYCDAHPEWQELREAWGICFTGHQPQKPEYEWLKQLPCPADFNRGDTHKRWGGNTAKPPGGVTLGYDGIGYEVRVTQEEFDRMSDGTRRLLLDLQARLASGS